MQMTAAEGGKRLNLTPSPVERLPNHSTALWGGKGGQDAVTRVGGREENVRELPLRRAPGPTPLSRRW